MSKKISIKVTEAQPLPCPYCNGFYGYQYSDLFRMSYTSVHNSDGTYSSLLCELWYQTTFYPNT